MLKDAKGRGDPVRVAIFDYLMPGLDGEMLARAVRADPELAGISLILATSAAQRGDAERFHKVGYNAYLTKPFRPETLLHTLEAVLAAPPGWNASDPIITRHALAERKRVPLAPASTPLIAPGVDTPAMEARAHDTRARPGESRKTIRVLLAEDNPVNQMVAVKMLERLGCRVDVAGDGSEAVTMSERFPYDIIFMDVQMPVYDGMEATRRIRARSDGVRIVAMTANAMDGDRELCLAAGMNDYVSKPITTQALEAALTNKN
jgi:CheY-like chemotaxis protein